MAKKTPDSFKAMNVSFCKGEGNYTRRWGYTQARRYNLATAIITDISPCFYLISMDCWEVKFWIMVAVKVLMQIFMG